MTDSCSKFPEFELPLESTNRFEAFCPAEVSRVVAEEDFLDAVDSMNNILKNTYPSVLSVAWIPLIPLGFGIHALQSIILGFESPSEWNYFGDSIAINVFIGTLSLSFGMISSILIAKAIFMHRKAKAIELVRKHVRELNKSFHGPIKFRVKETCIPTMIISKQGHTRQHDQYHYTLVVYITDKFSVSKSPPLASDSSFEHIEPSEGTITDDDSSVWSTGAFKRK